MSDGGNYSIHMRIRKGLRKLSDVREPAAATRKSSISADRRTIPPKIHAVQLKRRIP
jgi:hypothetical protein